MVVGSVAIGGNGEGVPHFGVKILVTVGAFELKALIFLVFPRFFTHFTRTGAFGMT